MNLKQKAQSSQDGDTEVVRKMYWADDVDVAVKELESPCYCLPPAVVTRLKRECLNCFISVFGVREE